MADAKDKKQFPKITSPKLRLGWPKLTEPDYGNKDYPKPDGEYSTKGVAALSDPAIQSFLAKLRPFYDEAMEKAAEEFAALKPETRRKLKEVTKNGLYTELLDKETEQPTGEVEFKFSRKASGEYKKGPKTGQKWHTKVPLFDAFGRPITGKLDIWGGTIAKVSFSPSYYFIPGTGAAGLKLNLEAVQIIELRQGGARDAKDYGFGEEDSGFGYEPGDETGDETGEENGKGASAPANPDF